MSGKSAVRPPPPRLRPLNEPRPTQVRTDARGVPVAVRVDGRVRAVEVVRETWRIDDEWWRAAISRLYHDVVLDGGQLLVLYHDMMEGRWFVQG